jgi:hypothetical protein
MTECFLSALAVQPVLDPFYSFFGTDLKKGSQNKQVTFHFISVYRLQEA